MAYRNYLAAADQEVRAASDRLDVALIARFGASNLVMARTEGWGHDAGSASGEAWDQYVDAQRAHDDALDDMPGADEWRGFNPSRWSASRVGARL